MGLRLPRRRVRNEERSPEDVLLIFTNEPAKVCTVSRTVEGGCGLLEPCAGWRAGGGTLWTWVCTDREHACSTSLPPPPSQCSMPYGSGRRCLTWGATPDEATGMYPATSWSRSRRRGDDGHVPSGGARELVALAGADGRRPTAGLVQLGLADNNGRPSANRIVPEWQSLKQGQHLARVSPPGNKGPSWFTVEVLEPNRTQVLHQLTACFRGLSFDPDSRPAPLGLCGRKLGFLSVGDTQWRNASRGSFAQPGCTPPGGTAAPPAAG